MLNVALHVHICFFSIQWSRQSNHSKHARAHSFGYGFDRLTLARSVASLKHDNDPRYGSFHPILQVAKLDLKLAEFRFVGLAFEFDSGSSLLVRRYDL